MSSQITSERLLRNTRRALAAMPTRLRSVLLVVSCVGSLFWLFRDPHTGPRPIKNTHVPYVARPGGNWTNFDNIFAFGDSWSSTGFSAGGTQPNYENPFGNPALPKNGSSHPPNYLYYLTMTYNNTFIRTYNIAHGAATIDRSVVPPHQFLNYTHTFKEQVDDIFFNNYTTGGKFSQAAEWTADKALFAVWFGVVDISLLVDRKEYLGENMLKLIVAYRAIVDNLYRLGARHFLLLTVPPMYLSPSARDNGHNPFLERLMIREFNGRLYFMRKDFIEQYPDAKMYIFDAHGLMTNVIQRPESHPMTVVLKNTTANCWDYNPDAYTDFKPWDWFRSECNIRFDEYLWANHLHPTHVFHNAAAMSIVDDCMAPTRKGYCS